MSHASIFSLLTQDEVAIVTRYVRSILALCSTAPGHRVAVSPRCCVGHEASPRRMQSECAISAYISALRSNTATTRDVLSAFRGLESLARSGMEFETACIIFETASCIPPKEVFGDAVSGIKVPLDEAATSEYIIRAAAALDLHVAVLHSLPHAFVPERSRPDRSDGPIIEELSPDESQHEIDVPLIVLRCLLHMSSEPTHLSHTPAVPWVNDSTSQRSASALLALADLSAGTESRYA